MPHERHNGRTRGYGGRLCAALCGGGVVVAMACGTACVSLRSPSPQPGVTVPEGWQQGTAAPGVLVSEPASELSRWWEQLDDAVLTDLVARALAANPDLRSARASLQAARARRAVASKDYSPTVSASVTRTANRATGERADGTTHNLYSAGFDASWEPDIFGATSSAVRAARADEAATEADVSATQVSLAAEVALNYVELRAFQAKLAIARDNLVRQTETLDLTSWRAEAGLTSELDVEQGRTNVEQTRAQLPTLETGLDGAEHRLAVLLGQPPAALHRTLGAVAPIPAVPARVVVGIPTETLRQRPDLRAAERRLAAATARLDQSRAARYPSLRLSGSIGIEALTSSGLTSGETVVRSLLGSLTAPLFDRGRIERQIDIQSAAEEQALASYERTILAALEEVENALAALSGAQRRQSALSAATEAARQAAKLARDRYAAGLTSYQTVLDTERSVLVVEESLTSTEAEATSALIRLYKALGGGWASTPTGDTKREAS